MNIWTELLWRLQGMGWFQALPEALRETPGLYGTLFGLLSIALLALWLLLMLTSRLFFGSQEPTRKLDRRTRRQIRRDVKSLKQHGNWQELGRLYESLGLTAKAIDAYGRGGYHEPQAKLLLDLGRRKEAKTVAKSGGVWRLYGELCLDDGQLEEAATAFERAGMVYQAARAWDDLQRPLQAARCYTAAGMEAEAVKRLGKAEGRKAAEMLETALRASIAEVGTGLSLDLQKSVRRAVQLWLAEGENERAFRLAVDAGQLALAVPVARDFLEPSVQAAEICVRADALLAAAEIYEKLGQTRQAALQKAEHFRRNDDPRSAAEAFEVAEEWADAAELWAVAGETVKAAEIYAREGHLETAAALFAQAGDTDRQQELLERADALTVDGRFERDSTARFQSASGPGMGSAHDSTLQAGRPSTPHRASHPEDLTAPSKSSPRTPSPSPPAPPPLLPNSGGQPNARYRLIEEIGRGGMGLVYRAEDRVLHREVAYKVVPENVGGVDVHPESLLAEARAAARLSHPNIVQVYDAGRHGDGFYVVMELIEGRTLEKMLADGPLEVSLALTIGRQTCAALDHAHGRRIIHRDLKPSNLLWDGQRVCLTDFGLARAFEESIGKVATRPAGTPSYMAPEQIRGEDLSPQADLYAIGCLLYEMLCRRPVFGTGPASFHHHLATVPEDPSMHRGDIPSELGALVLRCLAKEPDRRHRSASEIDRELAAIEQQIAFRTRAT